MNDDGYNPSRAVGTQNSMPDARRHRDQELDSSQSQNASTNNSENQSIGDHELFLDTENVMRMSSNSRFWNRPMPNSQFNGAREGL